MTTVLTFHRVVDRLEQDHDLTWDSFRRLTDSVSTSIADLESPSSARAIAMTFDDGTEDHLRAAEDLRRRGLPAVFFIPAADIGTSGRLDAEEVRESRARLEAICEEPVVFFAPPGGIGHPALVSTLRSEAYRACRSVRWE